GRVPSRGAAFPERGLAGARLYEPQHVKRPGAGSGDPAYRSTRLAKTRAPPKDLNPQSTKKQADCFQSAVCLKSELYPASDSLLKHQLDEIANAATVTPFVVIPAHQLEEALVQL